MLKAQQSQGNARKKGYTTTVACASHALHDIALQVSEDDASQEAVGFHTTSIDKVSRPMGHEPCSLNFICTPLATAATHHCVTYLHQTDIHTIMVASRTASSTTHHKHKVQSTELKIAQPMPSINQSMPSMPSQARSGQNAKHTTLWEHKPLACRRPP